MAQIQIDLSGRGGLATQFFQEPTTNAYTPITNVSGSPHRRYNAQPNQMVGGYYNPFKRVGYLSPANQSIRSVTVATVAPTKRLYASVYDSVLDDGYFIESFISPRVLRADGLDDQDLAVDFTVNNAGATATDLEIYQLNGERVLFYMYKDGTRSYIGTKILNLPSSNTFTADTSTDRITMSGTGNWVIQNLKAVIFTTTGTLPAGLTTGFRYYLRNVSGNTAQLSASPTGSIIDITTTGTGTHSISPQDDTWLSNNPAVQGGTTPTVNGEIKMIVAGDGFAYVTNGNTVHRLDGSVIGGSNGTIYMNVLIAPETNRFTGGIDYKGNLYLILHKTPNLGEIASGTTLRFASDCGVYIWNRSSSFFNTSQFIPVLGVREIRRIWVSHTDEIMIMTVNSDLTVSIRAFNGTRFVEVRKLGRASFVSCDDALFVTSYATIWVGQDGNIYAYGKPTEADNNALYVIGSINTNNTGYLSQGFACLYGSTTSDDTSSDSFYLSWADGALSPSLRLGKFYPNTNGNSLSTETLTCDVYTDVIYLPFMSTIKHIDIYCNPTNQTSSGVNIQAAIKVYKNQERTPFMTKYVDRNDIKKGYFSFEINKPYVNALQFEIEYFNSSNPAPSPSGTSNVSEFDFAPSVAVVAYEPTSTIKSSA